MIWIDLAFVVFVVVAGIVFFRFRKTVRIHEEEHRRVAESLQLINQLSIEVSSIIDLDRLGPVALESFGKVGGISVASLMLLNEKLDTLEVKARIGQTDTDTEPSSIKLGEGIAGQVAVSGKSILTGDAQSEKKSIKDKSKQGSVLCLPLKFKGRVLGVALFESKTNGEPFEEKDETFLSIFANVVAVAIANAKLFEEAITDGLTKLVRRRYFQIRLEEEFNRARRHKLPLSLVLLDLDHFKKFNDLYGHPEGDRILVQVAKAMKECTRDTDLCARYGGEECAIILTDTTESDALMVSERIRKKIVSTMIQIDGKNVFITISGGVATFTGEKNLKKEDLIERSDQALYAAKKAGRNRIEVWKQE